MGAEMNNAGLRELLEGYVDPRRKAIAINAIGESGLNVRLFSVFNLQAFVMCLYRSQHHRLVRYFQDTYFFTYETAQVSWLTEILRLMDRARSTVRGVTRENLAVPLFHERLQASSVIATGQKVAEQQLYDELQTQYEGSGFREFRNQRMFHLDLNENLKKPAPSGNLDEITNRLHAWYKHAAGVVIEREPRFITRTSISRGIEQAKALKRLMLDALRYQRCRGGPYRAKDYTRYGWRSGLWIDDLRKMQQDGGPEA
jgi:hypothetical protein